MISCLIRLRPGDDPHQRGASRRRIIRGVEDSLRRLNTDWVDLYQIHRPDPNTDIDETLAALTDLVSDGKIRYFGHSTFAASQIVQAQWTARDRGHLPFRCEQPPYSILTRNIEHDVLPTCEQYGMGVIPYSPLAGAWLSGRYRKDLDRSEIFLETKIWISDYGYDETLHAFEKSARKLGVEQIDLLILHQALPSAFDRTLKAYRALETLLVDGKVRAIGVSNFMVEHLTRLLERATVVPAVNQIECHPYFAQREVQDFGAERGLLTQAWSPIGGITFYRDGSHGSTLDDPVIGDTAAAHDKTPAQPDRSRLGRDRAQRPTPQTPRLR
jgi:diketogulonate reductase-like aldo/keto reductase